MLKFKEGKKEEYVKNILIQKSSSHTHFCKVIVKYYTVQQVLQNYAFDYYEDFY